MSKAWAENISDESIVDRYLTYGFDLNHNIEKDALMTYGVHSIAEKIRKDIRPKTKYPVGTVITWQVRFGGIKVRCTIMPPCGQGKSGT